MILITTQHNEEFSTSAQIEPKDVAQIAQDGYKTIINHRPDGEGGSDQPLSEHIAQAAQAAGVAYHYLPVVPGQYSPEHVEQLRDILCKAEKPIHGFCRSGARAKQMYDLAKS